MHVAGTLSNQQTTTTSYLVDGPEWVKTGTLAAALPGAWRYWDSAKTGWTGVSLQWLGEVTRLICIFYPSVSARALVWAHRALAYTRVLLRC